MKLSTIIAATAAAAVTSSSLAATIVSIGRVSGYHESRMPGTENTVGGGEFTVTGGGAGLRGLGSDINSNSFQTFCLELDQFLASGTNDYAVQIDTTVRSGSPGVNFVSQGTAWLYGQFRSGALVSNGYDYTVGADRASSASSLQLAIWFLQGQFDDPANWGTSPRPGRNELLWAEYNGPNSDARHFVAAAQAAVTDAFDPYAGGRVRVLNVGPTPDGGSWNNQDVLTLIPLPSGGGLAAAGLLGLVALRRRRA
ncbi:MAG: hypothetical protein JJU33_13960 [Phycisphaerales bacterium]|nr:hypothetical protein [Phycisphaerales bacterium]